MTTDLAAFAKATGVKYFMVSFTDLFGGQRAKLVPAQAIAEMQEDGAGFAGFATYLDMTPAHPDMLAVPDASSVIQLPWKPEVAWVAANCVMEGEDVAQAPRNVLRKLIDRAADQGLHVKTGIEAEFFLLTPQGDQISDPFDTAAKPCYDQQAVMRRYEVIREICDYMLELGWGPYQNDHEDANGQFEMNWEFDDALKPPISTAFSNSWPNPWQKSTVCAPPSCQNPLKGSPAMAAMPIFRFGMVPAMRQKQMFLPMMRWIWACRNLGGTFWVAL